ncbi:MAG: hypothetical protein IJ301_02230 [Clostridia bacterium]|nr:hypothetical protein [Clostridia bacterium]
MEKKKIKKTIVVATKEEKQALEKTKQFFQDLNDLTDREKDCSICPIESYCDRCVYMGCKINKIVEILDETIKNIE